MFFDSVKAKRTQVFFVIFFYKREKMIYKIRW